MFVCLQIGAQTSWWRILLKHRLLILDYSKLYIVKRKSDLHFKKIETHQSPMLHRISRVTLHITRKFVKHSNSILRIPTVLNYTSTVIHWSKIRCQSVLDHPKNLMLPFFRLTFGVRVVSNHVETLVVDTVHNLGDSSDFALWIVSFVLIFIDFKQDTMFSCHKKVVWVAGCWGTR